jgi:large conductance mechanosensitive channel
MDTNFKEKCMTSSIMKEFRAFAVKGNVIDLAVGVIIGGAFGKIVDSLVNDIVMPLISSLLGGRIDFTNLFIVLGTVPDNVPRTFDALKKAGIPIFAYGNFITISINFILLAFVIFQMVKIVNKIRLQDEEPKPTPPTPEDIMLLRELRDALKK